MNYYKRVDVVVDLETLGTDADCPIIQIGAVAVDLKNGEIIDILKRSIKFDKVGMVDGKTLQWWLQADADLLAKILLQASVSEEEGLREFVDFIQTLQSASDEVYLWGNGILFDNSILKNRMKRYGIEYPIKYRNDRDLRTILDLYIMRTGEDYNSIRDKFTPVKAHDAAEDALAEADLLFYCYQGLINH